MPRRKSGLNVARRKRADGSVAEYYYDRISGKPLGSDREAALAALKGIHSLEPATQEGTFAWLIDHFMASPKKNARWAPKTKKLYDGYLKNLRAAFGDRQFREFNRIDLEEIQIEFQSQPRKCNQTIALIRQMLQYAVDLKMLDTNPAAKPGMLPTPPRTDLWSAQEEDAFMAVAPERLALAFQLMVLTCQRPSDVLAMTRSQVVEREVHGRPRLFVALRQQKTKTPVAVLLHERLEVMVRARLAAKDTSMLLVPSPTGLPWAYRNFCRAWDQTLDKSGLKDRVQRRDLRRTGVVRLAQSGCTVPQIAAVAGWEIAYTQHIVDTYLPRRTETATQAILMLEETGGQASNVITLIPKRA